MRNTDTALLVDGNNLVIRAVKAMERIPLSVDGVATGPLHVFINMLSKYTRLVEPDYLVVCWDGGRSAHRLAIYADYKISRGDHDDNRDIHFRLAKEFLSLCNIRHIGMEGIEADDLVAAFWNQLPCRKVILSGDKDFLQLVGPDTTQIRPTGGDELWTADRVEKELGCLPENLPLVMALTGDKSDCVPGVPGIGQKTACKLLTSHNWNIALLLADDIPILRGQREVVVRNIQLVDLRTASRMGIPVLQPPPFQPTDLDGILYPELLGFLNRWKMAAVKERLMSRSLWRERERTDG